MAKVIVGIGIPGSGKTTLLKPFAEKYNYVYISRDDVRSELGIYPGQDSTREVEELFFRKIEEALSSDLTVVVDSTFVTYEHRVEFIEMIKKFGAEKVQGVYMDVSPEDAIARQLIRGHGPRPEVFNSRVEDLRESYPSISDGFDSVFTFNEIQNLSKVETNELTKEFQIKFK